MALSELDKAVGHSFGIEIDGVQIKHIQEMSGLKMEQDTIELKQNGTDGKYIIEKLPGRPKAGEVTLTRDLTDDDSFAKFIQESCSGKVGDTAQDGHIIVYNATGSAIKRYKLTACWPKSLEVGTRKTGDTYVLTEKLVITYEQTEPE